MAIANQIDLAADARTETGKGSAGRLRRSGRTPAVMYGHNVEPTPVSVDQLELYHAMHTEAGANALIRLQLDGNEHLTVARDIQRHPVLGDIQHIDFYAVDADQPISVEIPIHVINDEDVRKTGGVVNLVLGSLPIRVKPLEVPNSFELDLAGMEIGDVRRAVDIPLPAGAEYDIDEERTIVTINAPTIEVEEPTEEELLEGEAAPEGMAAPEREGAAEGEEPADEAASDDQ